MCCLFGIIDYGHSLTAEQKTRMTSVLATVCEARGTDATGIAYNSHGKLTIYKRPLPGHRIHFRIPEDAQVIMGHTRMTTKGSAGKNYNNYPFLGSTKEGVFALAHNGVLHNDGYLRRSLGLPKTKIETDSYIAVQLIEQKKALNPDSLRCMAEQVEGSFTFTVLDQRNNLHIVKGDNPMCLYHFPVLGLYLYTSTEEIMWMTLPKLRLSLKKAVKIRADSGEILRIDRAGNLTRSQFDDSHLFSGWFGPMWSYPCRGTKRTAIPTLSMPDSYLEEVKSVASAFGYTLEAIDRLAAMGFSAEELEEFLYCGEL